MISMMHFAMSINVTYNWPLTFHIFYRSLPMKPRILLNQNQKAIVFQNRSSKATMKRTRKVMRWRIRRILLTRETRRRNKARMKLLRRKGRKILPLKKNQMTKVPTAEVFFSVIYQLHLILIICQNLISAAGGWERAGSKKKKKVPNSPVKGENYIESKFSIICWLKIDAEVKSLRL